MRVISTFLRPEHTAELDANALLMVFDTLVDKKSAVVGITVGAVQGNDISSVRVSKIGQLIIDRLGRHVQANYPGATVVVAGVASVAGAKERVRKVLAQIPDGAALLLVCADDKVYDAAFPALGVDMQSANASTQ